MLHTLAAEVSTGTTPVWVQTITQGGAGAALIFLVKKMADGSIVWRNTAEMLQRATVAIEEANEREAIYCKWIEAQVSGD